jgi:hypothetical protein
MSRWQSRFPAKAGSFEGEAKGPVLEAASERDFCRRLLCGRHPCPISGDPRKLASSGDISSTLQNQSLTMGEGKPKRARTSQIFSSSGVRAALIAVSSLLVRIAERSADPFETKLGSFRQEPFQPSTRSVESHDCWPDKAGPSRSRLGPKAGQTIAPIPLAEPRARASGPWSVASDANSAPTFIPVGGPLRPMRTPLRARLGKQFSRVCKHLRAEAGGEIGFVFRIQNCRISDLARGYASEFLFIFSISSP